MKEKLVNKYTKGNYLIVILSLFSVSPFVNTVTNKYLLGLLFYVVLVSIHRKKNFFFKQNVKILVMFYILLVIQSMLYDGFSLALIYIPLISFYLPFLILQLVGLSFFKYYVKILYVIALITTPIWLLQSLIPLVDNVLRLGSEFILPYSWGSVPRSLIIYTAAWTDEMFNSSFGLYRNSGAFHEPGAYGVFLNLAIVINTFITGKLFERKNLIFTLCLLTTFSTAGYITFFVIIIAYLMQLKINIGIKGFAVISFFLISFSIYQSEDFLQAKVQEQLADQTYVAKNNLGRYDAHSGRFYAFYTSMQLFQEHPYFGRGILYATSEKASGEMNAQGSYTYGFMGVLSNYGIFFGFLYLFYMYKGFIFLGQLTQQKKVFIVGCFVAVNLALMSQVFITSIIMMYFFTIGAYSKGIIKQKINYFKKDVQLA